MKKEFRISEIADLFDVPISTLRYWEKEGLVHFERLEGNNYRTASMATIRNLCDITFYRKLAVPIEDLRSLLDMNSSEIKETLQKSRNHLIQEIQEKQQTIESIDVKLNQIDTLQSLHETPMEFVQVQLPAIRPFDLFCSSDLRNLVNCEKNLIVMIPPHSPMSYRYGVFVLDDYPKENLIRQKDEHSRLYLKVLMETNYDNIEENNLPIYYNYIRSQGYIPGLAIGKVLVSSNDGSLHNYYETWIELQKSSEDSSL